MTTEHDDITSWFTGRLPDWFVEPAAITIDKDEILVVGRLAPAGGADDAAGGEGRISRHREDTRAQRMAIADQGQERYGRTVSWGASCGESTMVFTQVSAPVMTRLRQPERQVLDTLVEAGVAKSRSEAVGWCVRLVGEHEGGWLRELTEALAAVRDTRAHGPESRRTS